MRLLRVLCLALVSWVSLMAPRPAWASPKCGYLLVIGEGEPGVVHDDRGPHPAIMGEVFLNSAADSVSVGQRPASIDPFVGPGRVLVGYAARGMSDADIQTMTDRGVHHYVFENEPDGRGGNWPDDYMAGLVPTYARIHSVDPQAVVIGGNLFSNQYNSLYQRGFKNYCDMVGFHCYSDDPATGIDIMAVVPVHNTMVAWGDGGKMIYLGEGWGPKRELRQLPRLSPEIEIPAEEIGLLRDFVVNGYRNIITPQGGYDPAWVYAVHFFTLNDNWGMFHWRDRAVPVYDGQGHLLYYTVDGYNIGTDIDPHFFNGGLIDYWGNGKDNLTDIFPGNGLSVSNGGFEYYDPFAPQVGSSWTARGSAPSGTYVLDNSIRHGGRRAQRIDLYSTSTEYVHADTVRGSVSPGSAYLAAAWAKCVNVYPLSAAGLQIGLSFYDQVSTPLGTTAWSAGLTGTADWTLIAVTQTAPAMSSYARIELRLSGETGVAWLDDAVVQAGATQQNASFSGYVLDEDNLPIVNANVALSTGGYQAATDGSGHFTMTGIQPGIYDAVASASGHSSQAVRAQVAEAGHTNVLGFALPALSATDPTNIKCWNPAVSGKMRISWAPPTGPSDHFRVYRSELPLEVGDLVHDQETASPFWDEGLSDGQKYYYTVRAVAGGVESQNEDRQLGIPTGGILEATYDCNAPASWPWSSNFGQTFRATRDGSLVSATCIPAGTSGIEITFRFRRNGPGGVVVGPSRTLSTSSDGLARATWQTGEVPVVQGQTYYLDLAASSSTGVYASQSDAYPDGQMYQGGSPTARDLWSTITLACPQGAVIEDVSAERLPGGECMIIWHTEVPSTSQVEYGLTRLYGQSSALDPALVTDHEVLLTGLDDQKGYHFGVLSTRAGIPDAASPDYTFGSPPSPGPSIQVWPQEISASAWVLSDPPNGSFNISKVGYGDITYDVTPGCSWLSVEPDHGTNSGETDTIEIIYDTTGLHAGVNVCPITVEAAGAENSPVIAPVVTLTLTTVGPDLDGDGDVDQSDFGLFQACLTGAGVTQNQPACRGSRLDGDDDVDQEDLVILLGCISGPGVAAEPTCAD